MQRDSEAIDYVVRTARENDVKFIRMWFTDILGNLKGVAVTVEELESALTRGIGFDGASIEGFARSNENDMFALQIQQHLISYRGVPDKMLSPECFATY